MNVGGQQRPANDAISNGVFHAKNSRGLVGEVSEQAVLVFFGWMNDGGTGWDLSSDTMKLSTIRFNLKASTDSLYHVILKKYSFGKNEEQATGRAEKIQYRVFSRDSVLDLASGYAIDKDSKFRGQQVEIEILVPVGKKIRFDESVNDKLNSVNVKVKRSYRRNRVVGVEIDDNRSNRYRSGVDYVMGINGTLKNEQGNDVISQPNNDYRYPGTDSIEKRKKQWEEEGRKIKEEEQRQNKPTILKKKMDGKNEDGRFAVAPSPVSSLIQWF